MKKAYIILLLISSFLVNAQTNKTLSDSIAIYFKDIKLATKNATKLWNKDLYGPIIIVNPISRAVYANVSDSLQVLKEDQGIFTGKLPMEVPVSNASIKWNKVNWAMILLPYIPKNDTDRINLFAHELFHRSQKSLGFKLTDADNNHLNTIQGRIYLKLELEALIKALQTQDNLMQKRHLTNAMIFRTYRRSLFTGSDSTENLLELNEGIAEYTGVCISRGDLGHAKEHFIRKIRDFLSAGTFVRTFPYRTTPVYGFFLREKKKYWNKEISMNTDLTAFFIEELKIKLPLDIKAESDKLREEYGYSEILKEEIELEENMKEKVADYKSKFIEKPHFTLKFENKKASFDSRSLTPIENYGTVYTTITVSDNWGVLTVTNVGALMSQSRDNITVTAPEKIEENLIIGNGWTLKLNTGYYAELEKQTGNYVLLKK